MVTRIYAQLGFCAGNSGNPIFEEDFGSGTGAVVLTSGSTTYAFTSGTPFDGQYNVSNRTNHFDWHNTEDHTPGDTNGRMLVVNADFTAGEFFRIPITGLCENTSYEFSSWLINLLPSTTGCPNGGLPINVRFEIWDSTDTILLKSGDTGNILGTSTPSWEQYALVFQTRPSQTSVILKMRNNGVGGCGNDLAIDDIVFKSCGDNIIIEDSSSNTVANVCQDALPFTTELTVIPDFSQFSSHFYQWQESMDGITWVDISGETGQTYNVSSLNTSRYYRAKVAEDVINVNNGSCNTLSEVFEVNVILIPDAPISNGDLSVCYGDTTPLSVTVPDGVLVSWYDSGGTLLQAFRTSFNPTVSGTYYTEAETSAGGCKSLTRTAVSLEFLEEPIISDEVLSFCENTLINISANVANPGVVTSYQWSTGAVTETISVGTAGTYTIEVFNGACSETKTIELSQIDNPVIDTIETDGSDIIVTTRNTGDFLYSLDGITFQSSNVFYKMEGGLYTIYVKHRDCDEIISSDPYIHFYIPKFFTPNNDGEYDLFDLKGIEYYTTNQVFIFDRYGKLLKNSSNSPFAWDGTFNNTPLPTGDYWYVIMIDDQKITGHFTLKR